MPNEASGGNRKALSRFINDYITELEKSDAKLFSSRRVAPVKPPDSWEDQGSRQTSKLPMTRHEYIKRQNALFKELTGHNSWPELSSAEVYADSNNNQLMTMIELYMAALDEKIYMSADYIRSMIGVRDKAVRDSFDNLRLNEGVTSSSLDGEPAGIDSKDSSADGDTEKKKILRAIVELRNMYQNLWSRHSQLSHQRAALEVEMSQLRYDHALQLAKGLRLEYATHSLGQKLVDAQSLRVDNEALQEELDKQQREKASLQYAYDALAASHSTQQEALTDLKKSLIKERSAERSGSKSDMSSDPVMLEERIHYLYDQLLRLKATDTYLAAHPEEPKTPTEILDHVSALIETGNSEGEKRIESLIESFAQMYRSREQELLTQVALLEQEKNIILARCEKLEKESADANSDLSYLEQRTLSLVLMLKSVRASLDGASQDAIDGPLQGGPFYNGPIVYTPIDQTSDAQISTAGDASRQNAQSQEATVEGAGGSSAYDTDPSRVD